MDSVLISDIVVMRLQTIALRTNLCMSEVVEALLDYHGDDQEIIDNLKPSSIDTIEMMDKLSEKLL